VEAVQGAIGGLREDVHNPWRVRWSMEEELSRSGLSMGSDLREELKGNPRRRRFKVPWVCHGDGD